MRREEKDSTAGRPKQRRRVRSSIVEDPKKKKVGLEEEAAQEDTGFGQKSWDSNFEQLRDFVRTYKHCNVPAQHQELGRWAEEQRQPVRAEANRTGHGIKFDGRTGGQTNGGRVCFLQTLNIPDDDDGIYSI